MMLGVTIVSIFSVGMMAGFANPKATVTESTKALIYSIRPIAENFWKNQVIQDLLKSKENYDVIISIPVLNDSLMGLFQYLGAPVIIFNPSGGNYLVNKYVANPTLSYCVNMHMYLGSMDKFSARLFGTSFLAYFNLIERFLITPTQEKVMREYLPDSPPVSELVKTVSLVLLNSHLSIEPPR